MSITVSPDNVKREVLDTDEVTEQLRKHLDRGGTYRAIQSFGADDNGFTVWSTTDKPFKVSSKLNGKRQVYWIVNPTSCTVTDADRKKKWAIGKTDKDIEPYIASKNDTVQAVNALFADFDGKDFAKPTQAEIDAQYEIAKIAAPDVDHELLMTTARSAAKEVKFLSNIAHYKALALKHIRSLKLTTRLVIDTGGGYQAYWLLAETYVIDTDEKREFIKWLQAAWVKFVGGDMGAKDIRRILRVPGFLNIKKAYGPNFPTVSYVDADLTLTYSIADFVALVPKRVVTPPKKTVATGGAFNAKRNGLAHVGASVIEAFNAAFKIADVLEDCGYTWVGDRMAKPGGKNGTVEIYEDDNESYHHGGEDPLHTGHRIDPFEAFTLYKHGGDKKAAAKAAAKELGMGYSNADGVIRPSSDDPYAGMTPEQAGYALIADLLSNKPETTINATWRNGSHDEPVVITGVMGQQNGKTYYSIEGSSTGVPADQVVDMVNMSTGEIMVDTIEISDENSEFVENILKFGSPKFGVGQTAKRFVLDNPEAVDLVDLGTITEILCADSGWEYRTTLGGIQREAVIHAEPKYSMELPQKPKNNEPIPLPDITAAPELPDDAKLTPEELAEAATTGKFLMDYVEFAKDASPMTPVQFNVSAGLAAVAIAIARRVHVRVGAIKIYPNLYQLYVGPSTLQRKTTGMGTLTGLQEQAGMIPIFTLAETQTPEAFVEDMTLNLPSTYDRMSPTARQTWLDRRRLYSQRGWIMDEASRLLDSFNRDYTSGLLPIVLEMYDSKDRSGERNTKSWGNESIEKSYLNLFGATTFSSIGKHVADTARWLDGLFARFSFTASNDPGTWQFWPEPMEYPKPLVNELHRIAFKLFGAPPLSSTIDSRDDDKDDNDKKGDPKNRPSVSVEVDPLNDTAAHFGPGAWEMWERYSKVVGYDMIEQAMKDKSLPEELFPSYGRFGTMLIKVAMLFAVMDSKTLPIVIERKHVAAAQRIVEMWRESLHIVRAGGQVTAAKTFVDKVLATLTRNGENWTSRRDLQRTLGCAWNELEPAIDDLHGAGLIERTLQAAKRGPKTEMYRVVVQG